MTTEGELDLRIVPEGSDHKPGSSPHDEGNPSIQPPSVFIPPNQPPLTQVQLDEWLPRFREALTSPWGIAIECTEKIAVRNHLYRVRRALVHAGFTELSYLVFTLHPDGGPECWIYHSKAEATAEIVAEAVAAAQEPIP